LHCSVTKTRLITNCNYIETRNYLTSRTNALVPFSNADTRVLILYISLYVHITCIDIAHVTTNYVGYNLKHLPVLDTRFEKVNV